MKTLLRPCIEAVLQDEDPSLKKLLDVLRSKEKIMALAQQYSDAIDKEFFELDYDDSGITRSRKAVKNRIQEIIGDKVCKRFLLGENTFDLEWALNRGKIVIFNLSIPNIGEVACEAIGRFLVAQVKGIAYRRGRVSKAKRPRTFFIIDECQNFITSSIEKTLSQMRKFGLHLLLSHQYLDQLDTEMASAILSNTDVKIIGRNSKASMKKLAGEMEVKVDELMAIKRYHFFIKSGDRDAFLLKASNTLVNGKNNPYYVDSKRSAATLDKQVDKYYKPIGSKEAHFSNR